MNALTKFSLIISLLTIACNVGVQAATKSAADCSSAAIQSTINAAVDGDTVLVPACAAGAWSSDVTVPDTKGITLQGAGKANTKINTNGFKFLLQTSTARQPVRVTGFRFLHANASNIITIIGTAQNWRVDNNLFDDAGIDGAYTIRIGNDSANTDAFTYGLIDHNEFLNRNYATSIFVEWPRGRLDPSAAGDWIWSQPAQRGTAQAVYVEDNVFSGNGRASQVIDGRWGMKYVVRYNTIHNPWISTHSGCTNHGRDPMWVEIYKNKFTDDANKYGGSAIEMRSTSGVIWGNSSAAPLNNYNISVDHERSFRSDCGGVFNGLSDGTKAYDGSGSRGYPALGQPGWGPPQAANMGSASFAGMFAWQNMDVGNLKNLAIVNNNAYTPEHLQFGRELFNAANMSIGAIANRPASCSAGSPRSIYVATNENSQGATVYVCTATNVWTKHWEPYVYPHPLAQGGNPAPSNNVLEAPYLLPNPTTSNK